MSNDGVSLGRWLRQLVIRKEEEVQASSELNNRVKKKRKIVVGYHDNLNGLGFFVREFGDEGSLACLGTMPAFTPLRCIESCWLEDLVTCKAE